MSINSIKKIISEIDNKGINRPYMQKKYGVSEQQIDIAQTALGVNFSESYRYFLSEFGSGDFSGVEFYGLVPDRNDLKEIPNTLWLSSELLQRGDIEEGFVVIETLGAGEYACLDNNLKNGHECPVVFCDIGKNQESGNHRVLANSFGEYFYTRVNEVLVD